MQDTLYAAIFPTPYNAPVDSGRTVHVPSITINYSGLIETKRHALRILSHTLQS